MKSEVISPWDKMEALNPNPLRYKPQEKQKLFHDDWDKYRFRALFGGTGSGKTIAGVAEILMWIFRYPGIVAYIYEPNYGMVRRNLIPTLEHEDLLGRPLEANSLVKAFQRSDKKIEFTNGSSLWLGSLEDPEMSEGQNVDIIMIDEKRLVRHADTAWKTLRRRLRGSVPGKYPTAAWITTTPDMPIPYDEKTGRGSVMYSFFEDPLTKNKKSQIYRMSIYDNKKLEDDFIQDIEEAHTGAYAERFIFGRFADIGGGSFEFDGETNILSGETLKYVDEKKWGFKKIGYARDFGWTNPTALLVVGMDGDDRAYALDEFYKSRAQDEEISAEMTRMENDWAKYGRGVWYCDSSEPRTIMKMREDGHSAVGNKTKRDEGIRELGSRIRVSGDGKPRLYVHPRCVNLISELQSYDENKKERDHAVDALRYAVMNLRTPKSSGYSSVRAGRYRIRR